MVFNSVEFILFFVVVYCAYRFLAYPQQNVLLLIASYFFYGSWDYRFLLLLWASTVIDFVCAQQMNRSQSNHRRSWLILSVTMNLLALGFFKYFNFFIENAQVLAQSFGFSVSASTLKIILPVGLSFYIFQSISYMVDVYNKKLSPEKDFLVYALFVAFFPQLVAGPIERAQHMLPQYHRPRHMTTQKNKEGVWFIFWGFYLKIFMADNLAKIVLLTFNQHGRIPGCEVLLGAYAFTFQIFGDFAGYSFIAMGIARLLGFELMTNFLFPYFVTNPSEFWRHWHISLSIWLRDYLYIPLGGNRLTQWKTKRNLMMTMFLGGLWHGAGWTYVVWGIYHGILLVIHHCIRDYFRSDANLVRHWFIRLVFTLLMFHLIVFGWLVFRSSSITQLSDLIQSLFLNFWIPSMKVGYMLKNILFFSGIFLILHSFQAFRKRLTAIFELPMFLQWSVFGVMIYSIILFGEFGSKQFIYFQF